MADRTTVPAVARELGRSTADGGIACLIVTVSVIAAGGDDGDLMSPKWHKRERRVTHDNAWRNYDVVHDGGAMIAEGRDVEAVEEREVELRATKVPFEADALSADFQSGVFVWGNVDIGPHNVDTDILATINMPAPFTVTRPHVIQIHPRQGPTENSDFGWTDQFSIMIIETSVDFIRVRIRRIDGGSNNPIGWGQALQLDIFVVDDGVPG